MNSSVNKKENMRGGERRENVCMHTFEILKKQMLSVIQGQIYKSTTQKSEKQF